MKWIAPKPKHFRRPRGRVIVLDNTADELNDNNFGREMGTAAVPLQQQSILDTIAVSFPPSSLPASNNWPGKYGFNICFRPQEKKTRAVAWTYSSTRDKLYVAKSAPCPINFTTEKPMPPNTKIRAMPIFTQSEHASDIVRRCVNHTMSDHSLGVESPEHLIRCECAQVSYETNSTTGRQSVVVPFENPGQGGDFSTYIFKFACFGSCAGGLNRRPIKVIFTLEQENVVVGRRSLEVKICACPGRDCKNDDKQHSSESGVNTSSLSTGSSKKRKEPDSTHLSDVFNFINGIQYPASKKPKPTPNRDGTYTITVRDREEYEFLKQVKAVYEMVQNLRTLNPDQHRALNCLLRLKRERSSTDDSE